MTSELISPGTVSDSINEENSNIYGEEDQRQSDIEPYGGHQNNQMQQHQYYQQ